MKSVTGAIIVLIILGLVATLPFHYIDVGGNFKVLTKDHLTFDNTYIDQQDINKIIERYNAGSFFEKIAMRNEPLLKKLQDNGYIIDEDKKQSSQEEEQTPPQDDTRPPPVPDEGKQSLGGIGAVLHSDTVGGHTLPQIERVIPSSTAYSHLKATDYIVSVDDVTCLDKPLEDIIDMIRGTVGTTVKITVADTKDGQNQREYVLVRGHIPTE